MKDKKAFRTMEPEFMTAMFAASPKLRKAIREALERAQKKMISQKPDILDRLVKKGLITDKEKSKYSEDYLVEYLNIAAHMEEFIGEKRNPIMVTVSEELLKRKEELEGKFKIKVCDPLEAIGVMENEMKKDTSYIG
jgi:polyhydroxyalkanoate synthesis regulator phasin